jgi:hypothetical protein
MPTSAGRFWHRVARHRTPEGRIAVAVPQYDARDHRPRNAQPVARQDQARLPPEPTFRYSSRATGATAMRFQRMAIIAAVTALGLLMGNIGGAPAQQPGDCGGPVNRNGRTICVTVPAGTKNARRLRWRDLNDRNVEEFGVVRAAIQLPGPPPEALKDLDCEKLKVLRVSVTNMNDSLVEKANIDAIELINLENQASAAHCNYGQTTSSACHRITSQITAVEARIQTTTSDFRVLNNYYNIINNAAKVKDCAFEQQ